MAGPTTPRRVLVVEDDASIRELLRLHLDLAGFTIDETGEENTGEYVATYRIAMRPSQRSSRS